MLGDEVEGIPAAPLYRGKAPNRADAADIEEAAALQAIRSHTGYFHSPCVNGRKGALPA